MMIMMVTSKNPWLIVIIRLMNHNMIITLIIRMMIESLHDYRLYLYIRT